MALIIANNAESTLAASLGGLNTDRTLVIQAADATKFPAINPGGVGTDSGKMTLEDAAGNREIVSIARHDASSSTFTVDRGQEGTSIRAWALGDIAAMRLTAGMINTTFAHPAQNTGAHQASAIAFSPTGNIAASTVQAAIAELDTEKLQGSDSLNAIRVLTPVADAIAYFTGAAVAALTSLTAFGRSLIGAADAAAARTVLGAQVAGSYATSGANNNITSLTGLTSPIPSANTVGKIESLPNPTLSANAMTLPASTHALDFRSATLSSGLATTVSGSAAALVIPAGATLGTVNAVQSTIVEVIINNAGTLEKAVVNLAGGNDLSETGVINTTAISAASTAANVFYSTTARTGVPYRVVRTITSTQATAGQWATSPSAIQGAGGNALDAMQSLGYGQTWQNVTGSRAAGTTYYNTTGKPITVKVVAGTSLGGVTVGGVAVTSGISTNVITDTFIVPAGMPYSIGTLTGGFNWLELR